MSLVKRITQFKKDETKEEFKESVRNASLLSLLLILLPIFIYTVATFGFTPLLEWSYVFGLATSLWLLITGIFIGVLTAAIGIIVSERYDDKEEK